MQLMYWEILIMNMELETPEKLTIENMNFWVGKVPIFIPKPMAYNKLKELAGQDFGDDTVAWRQWFEKNHTSVTEKMWEEYCRKREVRKQTDEKPK